jgi:hypothetical protein
MNARRFPHQNSNRSCASLAFLFGAIAVAVPAGAAELCTDCIAVRLEHPVVVRGPSRQEPDAPVSMIELSDGQFRAFAANATTVAIDGATPLALGGPARTVLGPGPAGSPSDCGRWLTSVLQGKGALYGLIHDEQHCDYREGETHKSMSIGLSKDLGLTWSDLGQIITADEGPIAGRAGGEGDCTAADGHDGYWYAYCLRLRDWKNTAARAPRDDPAPGKWQKWSGNGWNAPGLGGAGAALDGAVGMSSAYWTDAEAMLLLATASTAMQMSASRDKLHFATVAEPIVLYDANDWKRPAPTDLYAYPSMVAEHGFNNIGRRFYLTYTYIPPGADFTQRYLVVQEAAIALAHALQHPQVRTALSRWAAGADVTWATTGPPIAGGRSYAFDVTLGYLMTASPNQMSSVQLDECFLPREGRGFVAAAGRCAAEGAERRRVAGYVFSREQPDTVPIYSCLSRAYARFTSNRQDCDGAGTRDRVLGYALR